MARPKKVDTDEMLSVIISFYEKNGDPSKLKYTVLEEYAKSLGKNIREYDFRRDKIVKEKIEELQKTIVVKGIGIVSFKSLDIDALLKNNKSHEKLRKALHELNDFWHQIYLRAGDVAICNRKLLSEQTQLSETIKVHTLKSDESLKQYDVLKFECNKLIVENRYLRKMLRQYLYPSLANEILKSENMMIGINESENISDMAKKDKLYNEMPDTFDNMISADIKLYSRENKLFEQLSHQVKGE